MRMQTSKLIRGLRIARKSRTKQGYTRKQQAKLLKDHANKYGKSARTSFFRDWVGSARDKK